MLRTALKTATTTTRGENKNSWGEKMEKVQIT